MATLRYIGIDHSHILIFAFTEKLLNLGKTDNFDTRSTTRFNNFSSAIVSEDIWEENLNIISDSWWNVEEDMFAYALRQIGFYPSFHYWFPKPIRAAIPCYSDLQRNIIERFILICGFTRTCQATEWYVPPRYNFHSVCITKTWI